MSEELKRSLSFNDLLLFGVAAIMGSGGFNLIGDGIIAGGSQFPLALGTTALLFQGLSRVYQQAYTVFRTNTSESDIIAQQFGQIPSKISEIAIISYNIISVSTILIICAKLLFPKGSWSGQISFALIILAMMTGFSLQGIDMNKEAINFFSYTIIALLVFASIIGGVEFGQNGNSASSSMHSTPDFTKSFIYFYFVLAGFDTLMKFSQEAIDPDKDIPRSFYTTNALSTILTAGVCFSFLVVFSNHKFQENENIVARIVASALGNSAGEVVGLLSIFLMIVTGFVSFLTTSRYMFGLGKEIPILKELNEKKVPWVSVLITFIIATLGILVNHVFTLVKVSDITMTVTLLLVSAAVTRAQIMKGVVPIVEGLTTLFLGAILFVCFGTV